MSFEWTCRFCGLPQLATKGNLSDKTIDPDVGVTKYGAVAVSVLSVRCLSASCNEFSLIVVLRKAHFDQYNQLYLDEEIHSWKLLPEASYTLQPDYIPEPLRQDYYEACLIRDKSPKASATLARRCIQGMIRDFCGISKDTLFAEIRELRKQFDAGSAHRNISDESIVAIDKVRKIGNIGAHMEKDISVIVDVDPDEAQLLIELIEMLFSEWYIAKEKRRLRLQEITALADEKDAAKLGAPPAVPALTKP